MISIELYNEPDFGGSSTRTDITNLNRRLRYETKVGFENGEEKRIAPAKPIIIVTEIVRIYEEIASDRKSVV